MSLITRCPTCETMFRVVPDQLRVSEGWVRCGQCAEVFDATQNMVPSPDAPGAPVTAPVPAPPPTATPQVVAPAGAPSEPGRAARSSLQDEAPPVAATAIQDDDWLDAPLTDPQTVILETEDDDEEPLDAVPPPAPSEPRAVTTDPRQAPTTPEGVVPRPSFLHDEAQQTSIWRRPVVRIVFIVLVMVLLALLGAQFLIKERNRVAAVEPAFEPVLHALCRVAGCSVQPLRQIESIVIDSSSFSRVRDDTYHLGFSLKNTAPIDVAMPAIELSLTDPQDQPVIRRVILPTEFGARTTALTRSTIWNGSLALTVQTGTGAQRIAGYRLLAFYP